jgi:malonyl-CoA O-methyltransferase
MTTPPDNPRAPLPASAQPASAGAAAGERQGDAEAPAPDALALDPRAIRRAFGRAATTYDAAAALQREVGQRMLARLDLVTLAPRHVLDAGCGTGHCTRLLAARFPAARITGLDLALPMLDFAAAADPAPSRWTRALRAVGAGGSAVSPRYVCGDITALPLASGSADLIVSNLALQWMIDLPRALRELHRVLAVGGLLQFTTLGPDTLRELRAAFADGRPHVSRFVDMHDVGDLLQHAGFADPVMDMEYITLTYATPRAALVELKALGATNAAIGRQRGLMGRAALARVEAAMLAAARDGRIPATYEVVHGHAWKAAPRHTADGQAIVHFRDPP